MTSLAGAQADLYRDLWLSVDTYADVSPGADRVPMFQQMSGATSGTVLDAGCGSGKGAVALKAAGFDVMLCDLTDAGLKDEARTVGPFFQLTLWDDLSMLLYLSRLAGEYDPKKGVTPEPFDYVYCCDVLEHIPTEYTMLAIRRLLEIAKHGVFLTIGLVPDQFGAWVGHPLHQTVRDFVWWRDHLRDMGELIECRDCLHFGAYFVRPR